MSAVQKYSMSEERLNVLTHGVGLLLALFGGLLLVNKANNDLELITGIVYACSLVAMFLASTFYHGARDEQLKQKLKLLDHSAIYLLIAGTYTPFLVLLLDGWVSLSGTLIIWLSAAFGIGFKLIAGHKYPKASLITYLAMGWFVVFYAYPLSKMLPIEGAWFLLLGGACFSGGVYFYVQKSKQYTHAIWHVFVNLGCLFHFCSIYYFVFGVV